MKNDIFTSIVKSNELVESLKNFANEVSQFLEIQKKAFLEIRHQDDLVKITNLKNQLGDN